MFIGRFCDCRKTFGTCSHARTSARHFSIQETRSWDVPNPELPGKMCYGSKFGLATLLVSGQHCKIRRSWRFKERCTAVLFESTLVMAVFAPNCGKDLGCMKHLSRVSLKCCGEDVVGVAENSSLQEISIWSWGWRVQTKKTSRSSIRCAGRCVGKGSKTTMTVSRSWCGVESWRVQLQGYLNVAQVLPR